MALALVLDYVAMSIAHFVSFEVRSIYTPCLLRFLTHSWHCALVAVVRMKMVIYVATEVGRTMKPWASANKYTPHKPFRTVVSGGSTGIRSDVIVTIRTVGGYSDFDGDLGLCFRGGSR